MKPRLSIVAGLIVAGALSGTSILVRAQASAPLALPVLPGAAASVPAPAASAPTGPRLRTPAETADRAAVPGDLRPERPIKPQINIPFGKQPAPPTRNEPPPRRGGAAAATGGGIDDAAARCESQTDRQALAACRAKLAREARAKLPN
jgi:hypothetical protein